MVWLALLPYIIGLHVAVDGTTDLKIAYCFGLTAAFAVVAWLALLLLSNRVGLARVVWTPWSRMCSSLAALVDKGLLLVAQFSLKLYFVVLWRYDVSWSFSTAALVLGCHLGLQLVALLKSTMCSSEAALLGLPLVAWLVLKLYYS